MNVAPTTIHTVHDLRHRWKPHKERLHAAGGDQPTAIRFHRSCSWMARVEAMPEDQDHDLGLVIRGLEPAAVQRLLLETGVGRMNNLGIERHE